MREVKAHKETLHPKKTLKIIILITSIRFRVALTRYTQLESMKNGYYNWIWNLVHREIPYQNLVAKTWNYTWIREVVHRKIPYRQQTPEIIDWVNQRVRKNLIERNSNYPWIQEVEVRWEIANPQKTMGLNYHLACQMVRRMNTN